MLVGGGATSYAAQNNMQVLPANDLISGKHGSMVNCYECSTDRARAVYVDHMKRLEKANDDTTPTTKKARLDQPVGLFSLLPLFV